MRKASASLAGGYERQNGGVGVVDSRRADVHRVILDDFKRVSAWTGMLASRVENRPDDEEDPHRTFDFDTDKLLGVKKEKNGKSS